MQRTHAWFKSNQMWHIYRIKAQKKRYRVEEFSGQAEVVVQGKKSDSLETHHDDLMTDQRNPK